MVDHMKLHESSTDYIFGTTRNHLTDGAGGTHTQIYIFKLRLKSDHLIDDSGGYSVAQLNAANMGSGSYVTGISD